MISFVQTSLAICLPSIIVNQLLFFIIYKCGNFHECIVDVAYAISHLVAGIIYFIFSTISTTAKIIDLVLLTFWSLRLAGFLLFTRVLKDFKDERYDDIFKKHATNQQKKQIIVLIQFLFQGLIVYITSSPLFFLFQNNLSWTIEDFNGIQIMNYIALSIIPFCIFFEGLSDFQLENFKKLKQQGLIHSDDIIQTGLWKRSRHPNLFFDLCTWFCFALGSIYDGISVCSLLGPIILFCVMEFLTTPKTEEHMRKKRGKVFDEYVNRTNKYFIF